METWCIICLNQRKTFSRAFDFDRKGNYNSCKTERVITMCQKQIKLNAKEDVQEFVRAAGKCDFDIDVFYNRIIIGILVVMHYFIVMNVLEQPV